MAGSEPELPYERPHLSKGYLLGTVPRDRIGLRPRGQYSELGIELVLGERVVELDPDRRAVRLDSGRRLDWDLLCVATGSSARTLPGFESGLYLRELPEADRLRQVLEAGKDVTLI